MANFRYRLATHGQMKRLYGQRLTCPKCGRAKCFVVYVDAQGEPIATDVGKCDHLNSCGHHYTPRQWREDHATEWDRRKLDGTPRHVQPIRPLRSYTDPDTVAATQRAYRHNTLMAYLLTIFTEEECNDMLTLYRIGTAKDGSAIYWQHDIRGKVRGGKVMLYDPLTGHRVKEGGDGRVTWAHTAMGMQDYNLEQCLFGEHLLAVHDWCVDNEPGQRPKPVAVFESEKTAMVASVILNGTALPCVCVATGGAGNLNKNVCASLRGRDVILFPDNGMFEQWYETADEMGGMFGRLRISDIMEREPYHTVEGDDLGDYLLASHLDTHLQLLDLGLTDIA